MRRSKGLLTWCGGCFVVSRRGGGASYSADAVIVPNGVGKPQKERRGKDGHSDPEPSAARLGGWFGWRLLRGGWGLLAV